MAVRIKFDKSHNVIQPTIVLATRKGKKLGVLQAENVEVSDSMNTYFELNFQVQKENDGKRCLLWDQIEDFKLVWCREWDVWFEIHVETSEANNTVKNINAISLGEAELGQVMLHGIEINTENDISRDEYDADNPTVLYRDDLHSSSLLHRIMEKVPHYKVKHVDVSIKNIQRTFTFDGVSLYDAFQQIAEEINCIFVINSGTNSDGKIAREISVYDLESYCLDCGHRDTYFKTCPKCSNKDGKGVLTGYGQDTTIFVSTENLADNITYTTDKDSVKNCFRLEGGDDLMTATIANCNPNGSGYIWYPSDLMKRDMSSELSQKLDEYDSNYDYYHNKYESKLSNEVISLISKDTNKTIVVGTDIQIGDTLRLKCLSENTNKAIINCVYIDGSYEEIILNTSEEYANVDVVIEGHSTITINEYIEAYSVVNYFEKYNSLVDKYFEYNDKLQKIPSSIVGYSELMTAYYNTIDLYLYLKSELMPTVKMQDTSAELEADSLESYLSSHSVAVLNLKSCSSSTASAAVLSAAKVVVDSRYQVKVKDGVFDENAAKWTGTLTITNYSDEEDTATTESITVKINDDRESFTKQKIDKALSSDEDEKTYGIVAIFDLGLEAFKEEIKKYGLASLESFRDSCQTCLDILIEQGIADNKTWADKNPNLYQELYIPYYNKNIALLEEIKVREAEIEVIAGKYDSDGDLVVPGMQTLIEKEQASIQDILNFEKYLGEELWLEFVAYRREDTYSNSNYISDGLNNKELFEKALEFIETAKKEIYKSATLQHSITATLKNLLVMKEFEPIVKYFSVGNWIRVRVNDVVYRLRLISYTIDFENLDNITIEFSDVLQCANGVSDAASILEQAASMATSYGSVQRQASQGKKGKEQIQDWVEKGLSLTNMKIIGNSDNQSQTWDEHGILCREYLPLTDTYDDKQLKIINRGLYLTDDNWLTSKAGIGDFVYWNPMTGQTEQAYGVIADTLVGNLILSEQVGVYNTQNSITLDENGLTITADSDNSDQNNTLLTVRKKVKDANGNESFDKLMYIDDDGNLVINGSISVYTSSTKKPLDEALDTSELEQSIAGDITNALEDAKGYAEDKIGAATSDLNTTINEKYEQLNNSIGNVNSLMGDITTSIDESYNDLKNYADDILTDYKAELGQYISIEDIGLVIGARQTLDDGSVVYSPFKTVIDNTSMSFYQDGEKVSFINNRMLHIRDSVIESSLILGKFYFAPRTDGRLSLVWQED